MIHQIFVSLLNLCVHLKLQVINAYVSLMKTEDHLKSSAGGTVFMETTFNSIILNRDGNKDIIIDENDKIEMRSMERMISLYTDHDMVIFFLKFVHKYIYVY
jgi:DNA transposition AAA+ family ATPase